ncbi:hypothetical protein Tco_0377221 [Tanacetum coccineum]
MVNEGNMVSEEIIDDNTSTKQQDGNSSSGYDVDAERARVDKDVYDKENVVIGPSYDNYTLAELHHSNNDTFENVFALAIQNHEQPKSIPDTYVVNENNSNIISDKPNMDPDRGREEHDDMDNEQECALFVSRVNNLKCEVENCTKVNRHTAHTLHMLLPKEDNVHTRKQGLGFENRNAVENHFVLNKAKEIAPSLYNIDEIGKDLLFDHMIISKEELKLTMEILPDPSSIKLCGSRIPAESDSLPHAHAQTTKTYYKHQDSRIKKAQELNTKTFTNPDIQDLP